MWPMSSHPAPFTLVAIADRHLSEGRTADAIESYNRALAIQPALPAAWFNLAYAQRSERHFEAALDSYAKAIIYGVPRPEEACLNRAVILFDHLRQTDLAIAELEAAVRHNPNFIEAQLNLGNIHEEMGAPDRAKASYQRVLQIDPANGRALARLGVIATVTGKPSAALAELTSALTRAATPGDRAEILFALGSAFDASGRFDEAFHAIEAANWIAGALAPVRYDRRQQENLVDSLIAAYPIANPAPRREQEPGIDHASPVFICGMFRSGSTLAEEILGRHTAISAGGELELVPSFVRELRPYPAAATGLAPDQLAALRARYLAELPGSGLVTDKRCDNFLHIGLIKAFFPEAKIIHTRRHPLDNLLSIYFLHFGPSVTYGHDLGDAAHFYLQYHRLMAHWAQLFPGEIFTLDYDRIVTGARDEVGRALTFLDLPWQETCLLSGASSEAVRTASSWQVRRQLHARSSGRWRHYERQLADARHMLTAAGLADVTL